MEKNVSMVFVVSPMVTFMVTFLHLLLKSLFVRNAYFFYYFLLIII
jgi:hypothetical protein